MAKDGHKKRKASGKEESDPNPAKKKATPSTKKEGEASKKASLKVGDAEETHLTLKDIHERMKKLATQIPTIPSDGFYMEGAKPNEASDVIGEPPNNLNKKLIKEWASQLQIVLEELGLLLCCVSTATYRWGTDRSGAADQNLSLLNEELNGTQDQISSRITPRLRNILTPVVDLVVDQTVTTKHKRPMENGEGKGSEEEEVEVKQNVFTRHLEDPDFVHLCYEILARNAPMMRLVVVSNFQKMIQCIGDYLAAQKNDSEHHREFAY